MGWMTKRCLSTGKVILETEAEAREVAEKMNRKGSGGVHPYRCQHCQKWHTGHIHRHGY